MSKDSSFYYKSDSKSLFIHKDRTIQSIDSLLTDYIISEDRRLNKKASLLSYWLQDYTNYLKFEESFEPCRLKRYDRGDIIKVNLGYNIGSEEGGLHYAMVLNKNNAISSPVLTIIPLTSLKRGKSMESIYKNDLFLGSELYDKLSEKRANMLNDIENHILKLSHKINSLERNREDRKKQPLSEKLRLDLERESKELDFMINQIKNLKRSIPLLNKMKKEIDKMQQGSIALLGQITTISKIRIFDPKNSYDVLHGIKLSPEKLDEINKMLKFLYIHE